MGEVGPVLLFKLRDDALRQHLAQLDAPLIERVDIPDDALSEDRVRVMMKVSSSLTSAWQRT